MDPAKGHSDGAVDGRHILEKKVPYTLFAPLNANASTLDSTSLPFRKMSNTRWPPAEKYVSAWEVVTVYTPFGTGMRIVSVWPKVKRSLRKEVAFGMFAVFVAMRLPY